MNCISTSIFDIFKIGPGPSSSHTIGPMRAGADFLARLAELPAGKLEQAHHIEVELFGSLALTGKGHGTDRAAAAGSSANSRKHATWSVSRHCFSIRLKFIRLLLPEKRRFLRRSQFISIRENMIILTAIH